MSIWTRLRDFLSRIGASFDAALSEPLSRADSARSDAPSIEGGVAFTIGMIALTAKMAFADGRVSPEEIQVFHRLFHVPPQERRNIARFFDLARHSMAGFESYARDLARLFRDRPGVLEDVLDALFAVALADGGIHPRELQYLELAANIFGFSQEEFERISACHLDPELRDPYRILGIAADCSDDELKQAYRRLVRENHPDSLIGRGVPAEFVAVATQKLAAINRAHDEVLRRRKAA
jgi:DnaJ like chaperone protein